MLAYFHINSGQNEASNSIYITYIHCYIIIIIYLAVKQLVSQTDRSVCVGEDESFRMPRYISEIRTSRDRNTTRWDRGAYFCLKE